MRELISKEGLRNVANSLDQQMSVDISARGTVKTIYDAARNLTGDKPTTLAAVELLEKSVKPGDYVFITTGWADQPFNIPDKSETDGPPGASALARAIRLTLEGLPVIITDDYLVEGMKKFLISAGFHIVEPEKLPKSLSTELGFSACPTASVIGMSINNDSCKTISEELINKYQPSCCIAIERGAMNKHGRIHGMGGYDFSENQAKMDYLFLEAREKGIATIGIGDGGNEIGMANIEQVIREKVKNGNMCKCPCASGIAPDVAKVDVLIASTVSNWGGYAISCLLALSQGNLNAMVNEILEDRVLYACALAEFHDSINSCVGPSVDGCEAPVHLAVIRLMREIVSMGMKRFPPESK